MANLSEFSRRMERLGARAEEGANRRTRKIALAILTEVAVMTPVDEGRARSNWTVGLGGPPDEGNFPAFVPGEDGSTAAANTNAAIAAGEAAMRDRDIEQAIYITNEVPYIESLNDGSSAQAPAGFVQRAVQYGTAVGSGEKVLE